jgi:hypothetical protein
MDFENTARFLAKRDFSIKPVVSDEEHFGNWMFIATKAPLALRVTNDRGVVLDLMEWDEFQAGASERDWFNWDVVVRALGINELAGRDLLTTLFDNIIKVEDAFSHTNWPKTKDLLHKIEAEKRREFMGGAKMPAHA